jgi:hypothetical protein
VLFEAGRTLTRGLRGAYRLGNANNGDNAGSVYLNGNNAPSDANANYGVALNRSKHQEGEPSLLGKHIER